MPTTPTHEKTGWLKAARLYPPTIYSPSVIMAVKFNIQSNQLIIDPVTLTVQEFLDIWEYDKEKNKPLACKLLMFVFHMCDYESPYADTPSQDKESSVKLNVFRNKDYAFKQKEVDLINAAMDCYRKLNETSFKRALASIDLIVDRLAKVLEETHPRIEEGTDKDGNVKFTSNISIITATTKELDEAMKRRDLISDRIEKRMAKDKVRGDVPLSILAKGLIKPKASA